MVIQRGIPRRALRFSDSVAALGLFDGVHRGHRAILRKTVQLARKRRAAAVAVTFHPHPLSVLRPRRHRPRCRGSAAARVRSGRPAVAPALLMPLERRLEVFSRRGIKTALVVRFTRSFSRWSPERFVEEVLVRRLKAREVVVGFNFRFGHGRRGTVKTLEHLGRRHGFRVHAVAPVRSGGARVSSGKLREWIRKGKLDRARRLMEGPPIVAGRVVRGAGRGKGLGFATANLKVESGVLPPAGVYAVRAWINKSTRYKVPGTLCFGMANLGFRPTFRREANPLLEVHLFGFNHPLYRKRLEVEFVRRLRAERRFRSPGALSRQLGIDARRAKWYTRPLTD